MPKAPVRRALEYCDIPHVSDSAVDVLHEWIEEVLIKISYLVVKRAEQSGRQHVGKEDVQETIKKINYNGDTTYRKVKEVLK